MTGQQTLDGSPAHTGGGLWPRYTSRDSVDHAQWLRACATHELVGQCRACDTGHLTPRPPYTVGAIQWYEAACTNTVCGHEIALPGGRTMRGSTRHTDMPGGWWDHRFKNRGTDGT